MTGACDVSKSRRDMVVSEFKDTCKPYADYREMLQQIDPDTEKIVGDKEAAKLAVPTCRSPWKFPKQYLNS